MWVRPHESLLAKFQIARANGLHPIRDRETIERLLPGVMHVAKKAKARCPKMLYRNLEITEAGAIIHLRGDGPDWSPNAG